MSKGVVDASTVTSFSLTAILLIAIIVLWVQSKRTSDSVWKDSNTSSSVQNVTTATLSFYSGAVLISWLLFIEIMTIGYDLTKPDLIPTITIILFILLLAFGWILTLYIWIERAHYAFKDTEYAFSALFLKVLRYIFRAVCILLVIELIIWITSRVIIIDILLLLRKVIGGFWVLSFITEIFLILYAYLSKLAQLKESCTMMVNAFDPRVALQITKLVALQIKLLILLMTMIAITFLCAFAGIFFEGYGSYFPLSLGAFVGFICVYCSVPGHRNAYKQMCKICLWCCMKYVHSYDKLMILYALSDGEEVKSTSDGATFDAAKQSKAGSRASGDAGTSDQSTKDAKELTVTTQSAPQSISSSK